MPLHGVDHLSLLNIYDFDRGVSTAHGHDVVCFVETVGVGDRVSSVQLQDFLHHPDVPHFDDSVRVSAGDQVA